LLPQLAAASGWETEQMEQAVLAVAKILMDGAKVRIQRGCGCTVGDAH
jgi:hypothetical protein